VNLSAWQLAHAARLSAPWERATLLRGAVEDALTHLPLRTLLLRVGPEEHYGNTSTPGSPGRRLALHGDLRGESELWVVPDDSLDAAQQEQLLPLLAAHFQACLALCSRMEEAAAQAAGEEAARGQALQRDLRQQLLQSSKLASMGQLAADVAHELNSPLGAIMVQLDAAELNLERERYERAVEKIRSAARAAVSAKEIISKLLFYARGSSGAQVLFSLNAVVQEALGMLAGQPGYDQLDLSLELGEVPEVLGDPGELRQVVTNLLVNARDAVLSPGAQAPSIELASSHRNGSVCLEVRDRGPGIPAEQLEKIFTPFYTTKPAGRGTGLGLSISLKIVEQHGGLLTARARPGGGSCFELALPRAVSELPFPQLSPTPTVNPTAAEPTIAQRGGSDDHGGHPATGG
jgi:signal transduction histidine kinase